MAPPDSEPPEDHSKNNPKRKQGVAADRLEPTTSGALLVQSLLHLHTPHNALVLQRCAGLQTNKLTLRFDSGNSYSIESLQPQELLALTHHPAGSRVLDAIIDGATTPPRARRSLLRALEAHFADVIDDRIGARVGARCWAAADPYLKVQRFFFF